MAAARRGRQAAIGVFFAIPVFAGAPSVVRGQDAGIAPAPASKGAPKTRVVARLDLAVPAAKSFLLHATLPVPKGVFPRADGLSPFAVADHESVERLVQAQVHVVSRYPTGEADVVEILAPVHAGANEKPGSRTTYLLHDSPGALAAEPDVPGTVKDLLARRKPNRFGLRTRDVFGNLYWAELSGNAEAAGFGSLRLTKTGPWLRERRVYATMTPLGAPSAQGPPLLHMLGVHAYLREHAGEEVVDLDLRLNNGAISGSAPPSTLEALLGIVYWKNLQLVLPEGWTAVSEVQDPFLGDAVVEGHSRVVTLVKGLPEGKLHMMGPQAQFERRLVLVRTGENEPVEARVEPALFDPGLAFCGRGEGLWSWFEPADRALLPAARRAREPRLREDPRAAGQVGDPGARAREPVGAAPGARDRHGQGILRDRRRDGLGAPVVREGAGQPGGEGIGMFEGHYAAVASCREDLEYLRLLHRMNVCRQPQAAYDRQGDVVGYHAWLDAQGRIPFDFRLNGGIVPPPFLLPCARGPAASPQVLEVVERKLRPPYDLGNPYAADGTWVNRPDCLLAWWPHDDQHYVRWTKQPKALVWLANDSMAKDDLILAAEMYHLFRHESPHVQASWSVGATLMVLEGLVKAHPHQGLPVGREDAWGIDAMSAAYSVASEAWREKNRAWFDRMEQLLVDGEMPTGIVQRFLNAQLLGHLNYAATQTFESLFLIHAMRTMNESVFRGVDDARREALEGIAVRGIDYLFFGPPWTRAPNSWQPDPAKPTLYWHGPRQAIAVAMNDDFATPPFCDEAHWGKGYMPADGFGLGVEWYHAWAALEYAAAITEGKAGEGLANKYLRRTIDCGKGHTGYKDLLQDFAEQASDPTYDNSANWIGLLGRLQGLGAK
jgi:hypothetical protein